MKSRGYEKLPSGREQRRVQRRAQPHTLRRDVYSETGRIVFSGAARLFVFGIVVFLFYEVFRSPATSSFTLPYRLLDYLKRLVTFQTGITEDGIAVSFYLRSAGINTLILFLPSLLISSTVSLVLARSVYGTSSTIATLIGATFRRISAIIHTVPVYWLAGIFYLVAIKTGWFPIGDIRAPLAHTYEPFARFLDRVWHTILPVATLVASQLVLVSDSLIARSRSLESTLSHQALRARGIPRKKIIRTHVVPVLRREMIESIERLLPFFITYLVFVEIVFAYKGFGYFAASLFRRFHAGGFAVAHAALLYFGLAVIVFQTIFRIIVRTHHRDTSATGHYGLQSGPAGRGHRNRILITSVSICLLSYLVGLVPEKPFPVWAGSAIVVIVLALPAVAVRHRRTQATNNSTNAAVGTSVAVGTKSMVGIWRTSVEIVKRWFGSASVRRGIKKTVARVSVRRKTRDEGGRSASPAAGRSVAPVLGFIALVCTLLAILIIPWPARITSSLAFLSPPTVAHPFGTVLSGKDFLSIVAVAGRFLIVPCCVAVAAGILGGVTGVYRGMYPRDAVSSILDFLAEQLEMFPSIVILMLVSVATRGSITAYAVALMSIGMLRFYREISLSSARIFQHGYSEYSLYSGAGLFGVVRRHLFPELKNEFFAGIIILAADLVVLDANASFLGTLVVTGERFATTFPILGWGALLVDARSELLRGNWWLSFFPVLSLAAVIAILRSIATRVRSWGDR